MIEDCSALVLAGGDSRRMGRDKAGLVMGGATLLESVTQTMRRVFPTVVVSVRVPRVDLILPQVRDCDASGPLAGLAAGLTQASTPWVFAVACDMPFMQPSVIEFLAQFRSGCQAVVPRVHGHVQPLAAFYARTCLDAAHAILKSEGSHSLRALLERVSVCYVDEQQLKEVEPSLRSFVDLDTPQDVARETREEKR